MSLEQQRAASRTRAADALKEQRAAALAARDVEAKKEIAYNIERELRNSGADHEYTDSEGNRQNASKVSFVVRSMPPYDHTPVRAAEVLIEQLDAQLASLTNIATDPASQPWRT